MEEQTPPQRLRQLLYWMQVPKEVIQNLDLKWLAENLSDYSTHVHYLEARSIVVLMLEADRHGRSKRLR